MNFPSAINVPTNWPENFKRVLSFTNSHLRIIEKLGEERSTIGIFESFNRVALPKGFKPIMKRVPPQGDKTIDDQLIGVPGQSTELAGYSYVAVILALRMLTGYDKKVQNVRQIIRLCTGEVLNDSILCKDIISAAKQIAYDEVGKNKKDIKSEAVALVKSTDFKFREIDQGNVSDRPIDWAVSHWWSGE